MIVALPMDSLQHAVPAVPFAPNAWNTVFWYVKHIDLAPIFWLVDTSSLMFRGSQWLEVQYRRRMSADTNSGPASADPELMSLVLDALCEQLPARCADKVCTSVFNNNELLLFTNFLL